MNYDDLIPESSERAAKTYNAYKTKLEQIKYDFVKEYLKFRTWALDVVFKHPTFIPEIRSEAVRRLKDLYRWCDEMEFIIRTHYRILAESPFFKLTKGNIEVVVEEIISQAFVLYQIPKQQFN